MTTDLTGSTRRLSAAAVLGAILALVLAFVTQQAGSLGEGWMVATAIVWIAALALSFLAAHPAVGS